MTDELAVARFHRSSGTETTKLTDALAAAMADAGEWEHVIIVFGRTTKDNSSEAMYYQGGSFPYHGQVGLLHHTVMEFREDGRK